MNKLKHLDLFSGIGGFSLGLERTGGFETIGFCEIEEYPQKILRKHWPDVQIHEDVRTLDGSKIDADVITGGYPCQPFSHAGKRSGEKDDRHLWPEMYRLIKSVRPRWVIAENVAGHISMGLDQVLSDLEAENYRWWTFVVPACAVDAPHRRDRVWIIANSESARARIYEQGIRRLSKRCGSRAEGVGQEVVANTKSETARRLPQRENAEESGLECNGGDVVNSYSKRIHQRGEGCNMEGKKPTNKEQSRGGWSGQDRRHCRWEPEPSVGRVANGIPSRVDRLKCLGNAVVPQIPEMIGYAILEAMND